MAWCFILVAAFAAIHRIRAAEVCCPNVGCFTDDPPFNGITLPTCPDTWSPFTFTMYARSNQATGETFTHETVPSVFDGARRTIFIFHGWQGDGTTTWLWNMKDALLTKEDANVVIVDWGGGAGAINYFQSASNTRTCGAYAALVADNLNRNGGDGGKTWCIGHSLGAHACGHFGMKTSQTSGRITGLDPAGPWFQGNLDRTCGINPTSGSFVDIIHTDTQLGQLRDLGHIDFYPAGGLNQPGCAASQTSQDNSQPSPRNSCDHSRSYEYFIQSIQTDCFLSRSKCTDYNNIPASCTACTCGSAPCAHLGYEAANGCQTDGWFYVDVTAASPYCVG